MSYPQHRHTDKTIPWTIGVNPRTARAQATRRLAAVARDLTALADSLDEATQPARRTNAASEESLILTLLAATIRDIVEVVAAGPHAIAQQQRGSVVSRLYHATALAETAYTRHYTRDDIAAAELERRHTETEDICLDLAAVAGILPNGKDIVAEFELDDELRLTWKVTEPPGTMLNPPDSALQLAVLSAFRQLAIALGDALPYHH